MSALTGRWRTRRGWFFGKRYIEVEELHAYHEFFDDPQNFEYTGHKRVWRRAGPGDFAKLHGGRRVTGLFNR